MLTHLSIRDVVLIEKLDLGLAPGLTVLTGETGAGKSILLDSLGLALGERASGGLVRSGATQASVSAIFEVDARHPVLALLDEHGIVREDPSDPIVLRRIVTPDARSRAYVCDQPVGVGLLRRVGAHLVEIQGQHEQMGLADQSTHLDLLDAFGITPLLREKTASTFRQWAAARNALKAARTDMEAAAREEEWLRQTVDDLERLAPQEGEEDALAATRVSLQRDERRGEAVAAALSELTPVTAAHPRLLPPCVQPAARSQDYCQPRQKRKPSQTATRHRHRTRSTLSEKPKKPLLKPRCCSVVLPQTRKVIRACWKKRKNGCLRFGPRLANTIFP